MRLTVHYLMLFLIIPCGMYSQVDQDSNLLRNYNSKINYIQSFTENYMSFLDSINYTSGIFCEVNKDNSISGDKLLNIYLRTYPLPNFIKYEFYYHRYSCFTEIQRELIKRTLNAELAPSDMRFYALVSLYKLGKFNGFLQAHASGDLRSKIFSDLENSKLRPETILQMKSMATLANLNYSGLEDSLLHIVNSIYDQIKLKENRLWLLIFYTQIIPNSVAILNSISSVQQTLYLIDEADHGVYDSHTRLDFAYGYFLAVIAPKLMEGDFGIASSTEFEKYKEDIKQKIISDSVMWMDFK